MIVNMPKDTHQLFKDLEIKVNDLPQVDRNTFILDLLKFCIDWQFAYLTYTSELKEND